MRAGRTLKGGRRSRNRCTKDSSSLVVVKVGVEAGAEVGVEVGGVKLAASKEDEEVPSSLCRRSEQKK